MNIEEKLQAAFKKEKPANMSLGGNEIPRKFVKMPVKG